MSINVKLNKTNFSCAPLLVEGFSGNETIGYMCKAKKTREGFENDAPEYDNGKVYQLGDMVKKDGVVYKMIDGIGAAGYPPPRPTNWQPQGSASSVPDYDNGKVYQLGDMVKKDGVVYKMIDGIGAAGYPPPRPTNWQPQSSGSTVSKKKAAVSVARSVAPVKASAPSAPSVPEYDNGKVYQLGDMVKKDGVVYKMIDGIGAAGYPPPRPTNWQPQGSASSVPDYDNGKVYQLGDMVKKDGVVYKMIDGIGAAGYPPPRPTNWAPQ
jgi:hypothetical protein